LQTFVGEGRPKADIDDGDVGLVGEQDGQPGRAVVDRCDDVEVDDLQQPGQSVPEEGMVLGHDNAHGVRYRADRSRRRDRRPRCRRH
jgi:hypothetical protein